MARIIKGRQMTARYWKGREVLKEYKQGRLVYEKSTSIPDYLCFTALEAGQFTLTIPAAVTPTYLSYIEWSKDGRTWNHRDNSSEAVTIDVQVAQGDKVYWRGSGKRMSYSGNSGYTSGFSTTGKFAISGHLASILKGSDFEDIDFSGAAFARLFQDCSNLTSAEELILPSFTVASVFSSMFLRCTALVSAPELPPVTNLTTGCYYQMFFGCSSLTHVKCLATDISATNCLTNWLNGVSSTGTFIQAEGVEWPTGASGIPTGWVDVEKRTMPSGYKQVLGIYGNGTAKANINIGYAVNMKYDKIEVAFKQDEISNGMVLQSVPASGSANNGKCWFYNYNGSSLASKPFAIYSQKADGTQVLMTAGQIYQPLDTNPHYIEYTADGTNLTVIHNGTTKTSTSYVSDLPESCSENTIIFGNLYYKGWIFYFRNSNGNTQLADYVACVRESDNVAGFYDMVGGVFHKSDNANGLTAGEEI